MEKLNEILRHLARIFINLTQCTSMIWNIARYDKLNLVRCAWDIRCANSVIWLYDWNWQTIWRIKRYINIVHALQLHRLSGVNLYNNYICSLHIGCTVTHRGGRNNITLLSNSTSLYNGYINFATKEAVTSQLSRLGQMQIAIINLAAVNGVSHILVGLVWHTELNTIGSCQCTILFVAGGCTCPEINLEMFLLHTGCQGHWNCLWIAGWGEAAGTNIHAWLNESSCLFCSYDLCL